MLRMLISGRRSCGAGLAGRSRSALAPRSIAFALLAATPCAAQTAPPEGEQEPNALPPVNVSVDRPKPTARPSRGRPAVTPTPPAPVQPVTPATTSTTAATPLNGNTVATSASRLGLTVRQIPASIDIVNQQQIQEQGYRTTTDTAQGAVGVTAADAPGAAANFSMRGFSGAQINTLYNGIKIGPSDMTSRVVDASGLERVEFLKGPASLLSGEGATGGTVNYVNKTPHAGPIVNEAFTSWIPSTASVPASDRAAARTSRGWTTTLTSATRRCRVSSTTPIPSCSMCRVRSTIRSTVN